MRFTNKDIGKIASEMLDFFGRHKVEDVDSLKEMTGVKYPLYPEIFIEVRFFPSNFGTTGISCEYRIKHPPESPISVKINPPLNYYQILLKSVDLIRGYKEFPNPFKPDDLGNIPQYKVSQNIDLTLIKKDLEELTRLR